MSDDNRNICAECKRSFVSGERDWAETCNHCGETFCGSHLINGRCYYDDNDAVCVRCALVTCPRHRHNYLETHNDGTVEIRGNYYKEGGDHSQCMNCLYERRALTTCPKHRIVNDNFLIYYKDGGDHSLCEVCAREVSKSTEVTKALC